MQSLDGYIPGNSTLHAQLTVATNILALLAASAPQCVTLDTLQSATRRSALELRKICKGFHHAGFVTTPVRDAWALPCDLGSLTLEDVYLALLAGAGNSKKSAAGSTDAAAKASPLQSNLELILMQATMSINQNLFRLLRQFRLDCLQIAATAGTTRPPQAYCATYIRSREPALHQLGEFN